MELKGATLEGNTVTVTWSFEAAPPTEAVTTESESYYNVRLRFLLHLNYMYMHMYIDLELHVHVRPVYEYACLLQLYCLKNKYMYMYVSKEPSHARYGHKIAHVFENDLGIGASGVLGPTSAQQRQRQPAAVGAR